MWMLWIPGSILPLMDAFHAGPSCKASSSFSLGGGGGGEKEKKRISLRICSDKLFRGNRNIKCYKTDTHIARHRERERVQSQKQPLLRCRAAATSTAAAKEDVVAKAPVMMRMGVFLNGPSMGCCVFWSSIQKVT